MNLIACLTFGGNCEEAMNFYKNLLGGEITYVMRYGDGPEDMGTSPAYSDKILHGQLDFSGNTLYFSDGWEGQPVQTGGNIGLNLNFNTEEGLQKIYDQLKDGGKVTMELQDTFWNAKFASVVDKFGVYWSLNYSKPE